MQTFDGIMAGFTPEQVQDVREAVQLRAQDFGGWRDASGGVGGRAGGLVGGERLLGGGLVGR